MKLNHLKQTPMALSLTMVLMQMLMLMGLVACSQIPPLPQTDWTVPVQWKESSQASKEPHEDSPGSSGSSSSSGSSVASSASGASITSNSKISLAQPSPEAEQWWTALNDETLNRLEGELLGGNVNVLSLSAQVRVAQATLRQSQASLWPTVNVTASSSRAANQLSVPKGTSYSLNASLSWELDVWGRIDALTQVASANAQASEGDLAQAKRSARATLVQTYLNFRLAQAQSALLREAEGAYEKSLALTQAKYRAGVVSQSDVASAQTQFKTTQAQRHDLDLQSAQLEHALAVLMGRAPSELRLAPLPWEPLLNVDTARESKGSFTQRDAQGFNDHALKWPPQPPALPDVVALSVLQKRPDIRAAQLRVQAANAQVGVAKAAFFPPLTLSSSAGYRNTDLPTLIGASNQAWSLGPSLVLPLIDGGLRQANKEIAQAQLDAAVLNYRQVVLTAFQEVEDNLVASLELLAEEEAYQSAAQSALQNLKITLSQYQNGTLAYLNVVSAQTAALNAQKALLNARAQRWLAWNVLQKNFFM